MGFNWRETMKIKNKAIILLIPVMISSSLYASGTLKKVFKWGVGGVAVYGAYKIFQNLTRAEGESINKAYIDKRIQEQTYGNTTSIQDIEKILNQHEGRIDNLEFKVEDLDKRLTSLEEEVENLKESEHGKQVQLHELSNGLIVKRSLYDAENGVRVFNKKFNSKQQACHDLMTEEIRGFLKDSDVAQIMEDLNITIMNIDIIDSSNALEDATPVFTVVENPAKTVKNLISSEEKTEFKARKLEDTETTKYIKLRDRVVTYRFESLEGEGEGTGYDFYTDYRVETYEIDKTLAYSMINIIVPLTSSSDNNCSSPISASDFKEEALKQKVLKSTSSLGDMDNKSRKDKAVFDSFEAEKLFELAAKKPSKVNSGVLKN